MLPRTPQKIDETKRHHSPRNNHRSLCGGSSHWAYPTSGWMDAYRGKKQCVITSWFFPVPESVQPKVSEENRRSIKAVFSYKLSYFYNTWVTVLTYLPVPRCSQPWTWQLRNECSLSACRTKPKRESARARHLNNSFDNERSLWTPLS